MDPFPPSRAEAVRLARERGEGLGEKVLPAGAQRRLQPVVDKFFYSLMANGIETQRLGLWWANRMLTTRRPLEEKLTLFWHGHFATGENKVRDYRMMLQQNLMFRAHASGNFRDLLVGLLKDPAMLVFLDNGENINLGTDHGTATPMFVVGKGVKGGFYGRHPRLTDLDDGNMKMTTDFRSVYATMIKEWLGYDDTAAILKGTFRPLGVFV